MKKTEKTGKKRAKSPLKIAEMLDKQAHKCYNVMYFGDDCIVIKVHTASQAANLRRRI